MLQIRRGNKSTIPVLGNGEIAISLDSKELFFGAGGNVQTLTSEAWASGMLYSVGVQKVYKGNLFLCVVEHTSGASFPVNFVTNGYWKQLGFPVGGLVLHENNLALEGFLRADGSAVSRVTFDVLFAIKGTTAPYGAGNGSTTFNLLNITANVNLGRGNRLYYYVKV